MPKVYKSQLIEIVQPANSTATKLQFQDFPYLRGKQITGIESYNVLDVSLSPTGATPCSAAEMSKTFLTLYLDDQAQGAKNVGEWIQNIPLTSLHRTQTTTSSPFVRQMFEMTNQIVYWEKCFFTFGSAINNVTATSFLLTVYFK